ncbi:Hypothetical predicted protein [Podarcis lilfordi]|uniref:Uncharacterized protein n=1 Tax=Podarcis lilfordi TaxID=74358 RepID=A0AA35P9B8_9SAUR|nr:Hypothetical predicted protein [Podarcis lilfordi]
MASDQKVWKQTANYQTGKGEVPPPHGRKATATDLRPAWRRLLQEPRRRRRQHLPGRQAGRQGEREGGDGEGGRGPEDLRRPAGSPRRERPAFPRRKLFRGTFLPPPRIRGRSQREEEEGALDSCTYPKPSEPEPKQEQREPGKRRKRSSRRRRSGQSGCARCARAAARPPAGFQVPIRSARRPGEVAGFLGTCPEVAPPRPPGASAGGAAQPDACKAEQVGGAGKWRKAGGRGRRQPSIARSLARSLSAGAASRPSHLYSLARRAPARADDHIAKGGRLLLLLLLLPPPLSPLSGAGGKTRTGLQAQRPGSWPLCCASPPSSALPPGRALAGLVPGASMAGFPLPPRSPKPGSTPPETLASAPGSPPLSARRGRVAGAAPPGPARSCPLLTGSPWAARARSSPAPSGAPLPPPARGGQAGKHVV